MSEPMNDSLSQPGATTATQTSPWSPQVVHHPVVPDIARAIFLGDFSEHLGPAGGVTQIVISFIPGIGTVASLRDFIADCGKPEPLGIVLNGFGMLPILGGFSKTAEVMNRVQMVNESFVVVHGVRQRDAFGDENAPQRIPKNRIARWSVAAAIFAPLVAVILAVVQVGFHFPLAMLWYAFALPVLAIVFGHWGKAHAKHLKKTTPGLQIEPGHLTAGTGAALGWIGVILLGLLAVVIILLSKNATIVQYL